ncbi:MAG: hypothetical protein LBU07_02570 [Coriobacteriales bacterium]|nr:hypothetical protein [Coriobacteriales bacterium]
MNDGCIKQHKLSKVERVHLARLRSPLINALSTWLNRRFSCAHCKQCARRCEVLSLAALDVGSIEADFEPIVALESASQPAAVLRLAQERPELYNALRQCCFCGHCTAFCAVQMAAPARMREWRESFMQAGLMPPADSRLVMVDNEWHIFSAYRAIYEVAYPEFLQLHDVGTSNACHTLDAHAESGSGNLDGEHACNTQVSEATLVDTLFFPGCSLVSYAPALMRRIGWWLDSAGYHWAMSSACCGSPLMSAGLFERSQTLRWQLLEQVRAAGIKRILTVCPGCGEELAEVMGDEVDIVPLPELLVEHFVANSRDMPTTDVMAEVKGSAGCAKAARDTSNISTRAHLTSRAPDDKERRRKANQSTSALEQEAVQNAPASITFFDSCHDRSDTRHGRAVRKLLELCLPETTQLEMEHHGKNTLCCGAGGAVASYDAALTQRRVWRVIDEAQKTTANTLVTTCPTCTYTIAQALLSAGSEQAIASHNYLELVFGQSINWAVVFSQLEEMWTGEYGPWLAETFF